MTSTGYNWWLQGQGDLVLAKGSPAPAAHIANLSAMVGGGICPKSSIAIDVMQITSAGRKLYTV